MKKFYIFLLTLVAVNGAIAQWFPQNSGTSSRLFSICFPTEDTGYVVGHEPKGIILKTTNGGINWITQLENDSLKLNSVYFTSADTGYIAGGLINYKDNPGIVLKTTNGGESWETIFTYADSNVNGTELGSLRFLDEYTGYALGFSWCSTGSCGAYFFKTIDGGVNWTFDYLPAESAGDVYFINSDTGFVVGTYQSFSSSWLVLKTTNGGQDWTASNSGGYWDVSGLSSVYFPNANTGYAVGSEWDSVLFLKTTDGGINWTKQLRYANYYLNSVYFINADIGFVVGSNGTILKTINRGNDWSEQVSFTNKWLCSVIFTDSETGYIVGYDGTILKTTNSGGPPVGINMYQTSSKFLKIYPNPTLDNINIEISEISFRGQLSILNLNGQELLKQTIINPSSQIDISYLTIGIYFIRFINENTVQVVKIIKY